MKPETLEDVLARYEYALPVHLIANAPASKRDLARLLVHDRSSGTTDWTTFRRIGDYLPPRSVLILNRTKVVPARLVLQRTTGGQVAALVLGAAGDDLRVLANRRLRTSEVLALDSRKKFTVTGSDGNQWLLRPNFPVSELQAVLDRRGEMPLPPYIKRTPLTPAQLRRRYQSVFAEDVGSIAAPTASLHFTPRLLAALRRQGIRIGFVTLHVHLGTFAPLTEDQWKTGILHAEEYRIPSETVTLIAEAKKAGDPVVAVGTTVVRTLESASDASGRIIKPVGETRLFIREGYRFNVVDAMVTNFHVPRSSLLMLVSAFAGREKVLDLYRQAIEREFRFFSFGDAMLLL